jgi:Ca-activated chloride channel family protein
MNNDEKNKDMQMKISGEMEARIVAWVSGESPAEESAELERLVAASPVLAAYKARIEATQKLAAEALSPDAQPLRMSKDRRASLLREIGGTPAAARSQSDTSDVPVLVALQRKQRRERRWMLAVAACLTTGLFLTLMIPSYQKTGAVLNNARSLESAALYVEKSKADAPQPVNAVEFDVQAEKKEEVTLSASPAEAPPHIDMPVQIRAIADGPESRIAQARMEAARRTYGAFRNDPKSFESDKLDMGLIAGSEAKRATDAQAREEAADNAASGAPASTYAVDAGRLGGSAGFNGGGALATNGKILAAPGERADAESEAPTVLSPFSVNEPEDQGHYRANSTLAGTRVRTDLTDVASAISVVTGQFLQDTRDANGRNLLSYSPKTATSESPDSVTTTASAAAALLAVEAPVLSPFAADAPQDEQSYKAIETDPTAKVADAEIQAVLSSAGTISFVPRSPSAVLFGTGSPAGIPDSLKTGASKAAVAFGEVSAAREPMSTFSLHVSDVSFRLAQSALARGEAPDPAQIRPEEFYNAFDYGDRAPAMAEKIACHVEQSVDPVMQQRNLLRIAMKVPATGHGANQPLRLTVLLDTSGSMEREDRALAVKSAMKVLVSLLGRDDRVTLVGFARSPRLLAEQVHGDKAGSLLDIIAKTPPDGGTNLEEALKLGSELAQRQFAAGAQNRIVLLTDGAANLGDADPAHLAALVESLRQRDIAFDACGVGSGGIDDSVLEALTRKGSGRYYVLDTPEAADAGFARQLAGAFRPAAENVKVQVRFNPSRVGSYRLIGFENHRLNKEDFSNDKVAAAALAGGEAAVALYEVQALPQGEGDLGEVFARFRDTATGLMVERSWALPYDPYAPAFDRATPSMQLAGTAALLAEKLRGGARADAINLAQLAPIVNSLRNHYSHEVPVQELAAMYQQMRRMRGE